MLAEGLFSTNLTLHHCIQSDFRCPQKNNSPMNLIHHTVEDMTNAAEKRRKSRDPRNQTHGVDNTPLHMDSPF
eukprot:scaffold34595_cov110-Skeletonema_dohrnii-CCMP3373.AAC.6